MQYNLRIVKEWHRGQDAELDEDPPESGVFRFTLDSNGLLDIERLSDWPEYKSCRCRTHKYFFIDCAEAQRTCIFQIWTCTDDTESLMAKDFSNLGHTKSAHERA
ncbi:hypothetical protein BFJ65_g1945 [Fusarium oxysporum f. sp. cepae]|nr:hypothetical protein BFJ65_g1945 [Fusarium oxysporum f. sp. cepae]